LGMFWGSMLMAGVSIVQDHAWMFETSTTYIASLLYLALFGSALAFGCYLKLIALIGADRGAYATVMFPVIAMALSTWLEDYQWTLLSGLGGTLIIIGNVLILQAGRVKHG
ncbi:MAG: EamA family transporter, partial [Pseudomonadota bacterium]